MARSYKQTPIHGHAAVSEKQDKRMANRRYRSRVRQVVYAAKDYDAVVYPLVREISNVWGMGKDGKRWWRKRPWNADRWEKRMRK